MDDMNPLPLANVPESQLLPAKSLSTESKLPQTNTQSAPLTNRTAVLQTISTKSLNAVIFFLWFLGVDFRSKNLSKTQ
jgi:hypothetical protein